MYIDSINIVKMAILPKAMHSFNTFPLNIPMTFFAQIEESILKLMWNHKDSVSKAISSKQSNAAGVIPDLKLNYITIVTEATWY
jgi:hypothetical protein